MACLCLLLLVFAATGEARHFHSNGNDALRCSVCVIAHSPTLLARVALAAPVRVSQPLVAVTEVAVIPALAHDSYYIRPPPTPESV